MGLGGCGGGEQEGWGNGLSIGTGAAVFLGLAGVERTHP